MIVISLYSLICHLSRVYNHEMEQDIRRKLGNNIKIERIRRDMTQEQFAELIDISLSHASKIEQGLTSPTAIVLYKMAKTLKIPM